MGPTVTQKRKAAESPVTAAAVATPVVTNPKTLIGVKKVSLSCVPPSSLIELARAMMNGASKYGKMNYRDSSVEASIYVDAAFRHILSWYDGEQNAEDSGVHHLGHAMASLAILIDAAEQGTLIDDRPKPGKASAMLERYREKY
jgi:hypothetical protein